MSLNPEEEKEFEEYCQENHHTTVVAPFLLAADNKLKSLISAIASARETKLLESLLEEIEKMNVPQYPIPNQARALKALQDGALRGYQDAISDLSTLIKSKKDNLTK